MNIPIKKILFFIASLFVLVNESYSQKKKYSRNGSIAIKNSLEHSQTIPKGVDPANENRRLEDIRQDLLNYFVNQNHSIKYYAFNNGKEKIHIDSLLPKFKKYIDAFVQSGKWKINEDTEYLKNERTKNIYEKIKFESDKILNNIINLKLKKILDTITKIPASREKVWLTLEYDRLKIQNDTYWKDVDAYCKSAQKIADMIADPFERGKSYAVIGNFAAHYHINNIAIWSYYWAREDIQNSSKDSITKYKEQGLICERLADIFISMDLRDAQLKASDYFRQAAYNFSKANNIIETNVCYAYIDAINTYLIIDLPNHNIGDKKEELFEELEILQRLKNWHYSISEKHNYGSETNFLNYYSIGTFLRGENKNKEALISYFDALLNAKNISNTRNLQRSIYYIAFTYALLGKEKLAMDYSDLCISLTEKINDKFGYYWEFLQRANYYLILNKYDSALVYVNKIHNNVNLFNILGQSSYYDLLDKVYRLKNEIYDSLSKKTDLLQSYRDSALTYRNHYLQFEGQHLEYYPKLLQLESDSKAGWVDRNRAKEKQLFNNVISLLRNERMRLISGINVLKSDTSILGLLNRNYSDSLFLKQKEIGRLNNSALYYSSLSNKYEKDADNFQRTADIAKKQRNNAYWTAAIVTIVLIMVSFFLGLNINKQIRKNKGLKNENSKLEKLILAQKQEAERIAKENRENNYKLILEKRNVEMKLLSTLAINHDIDKFIPSLPDYIKNIHEESKSKLVSAVEKFKAYYLATKHTGNSLTNTIKAEVEIAKISSEVYLYMVRSKTVPNIVTNFSGNSEIENLEIPKNMITSFIANSIKHGAIGKTNITVTVNAWNQENGYSFLIEDNGMGFQLLDLENKEQDKGINLILNQVKNYNENNEKYEIVFTAENIINKKDDSGVIVSFKILKKWPEEILL